VSGVLSERAGTGAGASAAGSEVVLPATASAAPPAALQAAPRMARSALARAQGAAGEIVPRLQYQLARLGPAGQTGLVALVAALVFAASTLLPAQHALDSLSADLARAQHPSGAQSPDQAVPRLVESLPTRAQIPAVIGLIYAEASKSGVPLDVGHYSYSSPKAGALGRYDVEFPVKAGYPQIRTFINGTLTAVPAAALDKLHVERKTVGDAGVSANIGFVIYVRSE
jgi:hypothetical protein